MHEPQNKMLKSCCDPDYLLIGDIREHLLQEAFTVDIGGEA